MFLVDSQFSPHWCLLDQFVTDLAATEVHATGHQLVSLWPSVCAEENTQISNPLINNTYLSLGNSGKSFIVYNIIFMLTELIETLNRLGQGPSHTPHGVPKTPETSGDESDKVKAVEKLCQKNSSNEENLWGGHTWEIFVTEATGAANKPSHFDCRICWKDVSVLTHGH